MRDQGPAHSAKRVIVLGAGIAGLAAAEKLANDGHHVTVIEQAPQAGGTHRCRHIGPYTFDVGSIFYEQNARLFDLAPGLRELCPTVVRVQRRIAPDGSVLHYPLEPRELLRGPIIPLIKAAIDLAWSRLTVRRDGTLDAISRKRLGGTLFKSTGLREYIARFHHVPPSEIDEAFFFHRMAFIERFTRVGTLVQSMLQAVIARRSVNAKIRRPLHVRPREGYSQIFDPVIARLQAAGVEFVFGTELISLSGQNGLFRVTTSVDTDLAEVVVSTIPLDTLHRAMFGSGSGLVSLDMTTLFVSCGYLDARLGNVLFNFHPQGRWKRATLYSRIYPEAGIAREFLAVETTIPPDGTHDPQAIFKDFKKHMQELGLADDLILEGHEHVMNCYPLYSPGSSKRLQEVILRIMDEGVILAGRQGRFEYLPTSSGVIRRVAEELDAAQACLASTKLAA